MEVTSAEAYPTTVGSAASAPRSPLSVGLVSEPLPWRRASGMASDDGLVLADVAAIYLAATIAIAAREWLRGPMPLPDTFWGVAGAWFAMRCFWHLYPAFGVAPAEELRR